MPRRSSAAVRRRLVSQAVGESMAMVVLPWTAFGLLDAPVTVPNLLGAAAAVVLLAQGTAWWVVRRWALRRPGVAIPGLDVFSWLRRANPVGLAVVFAVLVTAAFDRPGVGRRV